MEKMDWNDEFMEMKLGSEVSREYDVMRFLYVLIKGNIQKTNKIIDWISEYERQHAEKSAEKSENLKVLRYELSHDKAGLVAYFADGNSYHIHSDELTLDQVLIRNQLLEMDGDAKTSEGINA